MRADGSHVRQITHLAGFPQEPSWSPGGSRLVFEINPPKGGCPNIYSIGVDGMGLRQITHFTTDNDPREPEYSPDRRWIVFAQSPAGNGFAGGPYAIYLIHPNGTGLHRLTPLRMDAAHPEWSPNGGVIIFNNDFRKNVGDIVTIHRDGTHLARLTHVIRKKQADYRPDYPPGGKKIVFTHLTPGQPSSIWIINANGSGAHVLHSGQAFAADWGSKPGS